MFIIRSIKDTKSLIVYHDATDPLYDDNFKNLSPKQRSKILSKNYRLTTTAIIQPDNKVVVGVACCTGKDTFSKKKGRLLSKHRLIKYGKVIGSLLETEIKGDQKKRRAMALKMVKTFSHQLRDVLKREHRSQSVSSLIGVDEPPKYLIMGEPAKYSVPKEAKHETAFQ